jgi:hypothetical protein
MLLYVEALATRLATQRLLLGLARDGSHCRRHDRIVLNIRDASVGYVSTNSRHQIFG